VRHTADDNFAAGARPAWGPVLHWDAATDRVLVFYSVSRECSRPTTPKTWEPGGDVRAGPSTPFPFHLNCIVWSLKQLSSYTLSTPRRCCQMSRHGNNARLYCKSKGSNTVCKVIHRMLGDPPV
jgi:hypothetical protein